MSRRFIAWITSSRSSARSSQMTSRSVPARLGPMQRNFSGSESGSNSTKTRPLARAYSISSSATLCRLADRWISTPCYCNTKRRRSQPPDHKGLFSLGPIWIKQQFFRHKWSLSRRRGCRNALRREPFGWALERGLELVGRIDLYLQDFRQTGLTLAAETSTTIVEFMHRSGHLSSSTLMRYQHATKDSDRIIAKLSARSPSR